MDRKWTPEHKVTVTDAGVVIKIKMTGIRMTGLRTTFEAGQFGLHGEHEDFGPFEIKFDIPPGYSRAKLKMMVVKGILRIDLPPGADKPFLSDFPKNMLIYCDGCGKHFDIVIQDKGPANYPCPACGKVQIFDLEALVKQVTQQSKNLLRKKRGRL